MSKILFSLLLSMLILMPVAAGCASSSAGEIAGANVVEVLSGAADEGFARAYEPIPFQFPADHGPHPEFQTEWWYYTGNLADVDGNEYGYQLTFFRSALTPEMPPRTSDFATNQVYMAHFALTDVTAGQHESFELFNRGAGGVAGATTTPEVQVWLDDWFMRQVEPGVMHLVAGAQHADGEFAIDLYLRETRPPIYHGDQGLSQKGPEPGNASYYYSLIGLETSGTVTRRGSQVDVTGLSWMDHEFGTSALSEGALGWDWFSVQMDNGAVLMLAQIRTEDGSGVDEFEGTLVDGAGNKTVIQAADFTLAVRDEWTSPTTGIVYPSGWSVEVPALALTLAVEPLIDDQEMNVSYIYWEGAVRAEGVMQGEPVTGRGYVELTGYGSRGGYQR